MKAEQKEQIKTDQEGQVKTVEEAQVKQEGQIKAEQEVQIKIEQEIQVKQKEQIKTQEAQIITDGHSLRKSMSKFLSGAENSSPGKLDHKRDDASKQKVKKRRAKKVVPRSPTCGSTIAPP